MIFIIHGDNFSKSRDAVLKIQSKFEVNNKIELNILDTTPNQLKEHIMSFDIFSKAPFIVLDISNAGRKNLKDHVAVLEKAPRETNIVVLSNKSLSKTNAFIKAKNILKAKEVRSTQEVNANIFKFVDYAFTKNRKTAYKELQNLLVDDTDPFYLFSMLIYGLRNISYSKFDSPNFKNASPFVKTKAQKQANYFTKNQLIKLYDNFYKIDKDVKTGKLSTEILVPYALEKILEC